MSHVAATAAPEPAPSIPASTSPRPGGTPIAELAERKRLRRWTRDEYYRALSVGLFRPDERLELIRGEVVEKVAHDPIHTSGIELLQDNLEPAFAGQPVYCRYQSPVTLLGDSDPEPDVAVVYGARGSYRKAHPTPTDILLLVEVANTTVTNDRKVMGPLYAEAGILEYWILNVRDSVLEVYRDAATTGFAEPMMVLGANDVVSPLALPDKVLRVADLLPSDDE